VKFTLTIELGNEAMQTGEDVVGALKSVIRSPYLPCGEFTESIVPIDPVTIRDENGNTVGSWEVSE